MFLLNGNTLPQGTAFTANGIQYPSNWLNLSTLAEKEAIGITEVIDPVRADDRFYWDGNTENPKALEDKDGSVVAQFWFDSFSNIIQTISLKK